MDFCISLSTKQGNSGRIAVTQVDWIMSLVFRFSSEVFQSPNVFCKTWTGTFGTLANRADPDLTTQNAASDQGLHCLFESQEIIG